MFLTPSCTCSFLRSLCRGLCGCGMIPWFTLNRGGWVSSPPSSESLGFPRSACLDTRTCPSLEDTQQFWFHLLFHHFRHEMEPFSPRTQCSCVEINDSTSQALRSLESGPSVTDTVMTQLDISGLLLRLLRRGGDRLCPAASSAAGSQDG